MNRRYRIDIRNRLLATVAFSALMCGGALAEPAAFSWNGPYVGVNLGYVGTASRGHNNDGAGFGSASTSGSSALGGIEAGYNWQFGTFVLGAEADFDFTGADSSGSGLGNFGPTNYATRLSELGTLRGRVGYAFAPVPLLVYATAGIAYGNVKNSAEVPNFPFSVVASNTDWRAGWAAGGGLEYAFTPNWTVRAEGLYVDLGGTEIRSTQVVPYRFAFRDTAAIGRTELTFKF